MRRVLFFLLIVALTAAAACAPYQPRHKGGIDPSSGIYSRDDEDIVVLDSLPLVLKRTYLSGDHASRQFGVGGTHAGEWYLIGDGRTFQWAELILEDGGRIHFDRVSPGTSAVDGVFEHRSTPTRFFGARLRWSQPGWALALKDGGTALFKHCNPDNSDRCSILEMGDAAGHRIRYLRDSSGLLVEMQGETRRIVFDYDSSRRIIRASDSSDHWVSYEYDRRGRLSRARDSDGTVRRYAYSSRDEMLTIDEPGWFIENEFDGDGRVVRQTTRYPDSDDVDTIRFAYTVRNGAVVQTDTTEYDGTHTRTTYNSNGYRISDLVDVDGARPVQVLFDRDERTNIAHGGTVRCPGGDRRVSFDAAEGSVGAQAIVARTCR
ncbi:MAG: DUF6531 domain-containing protein [Acidobacteriota bacterium]